MHRLLKATLCGIFIGLSGILISLMPVCLSLEEGIGLSILFKLRGPLAPPSDVVVVSLSRESAEQLSLPIDTRKWSRSLYADLVDYLHSQGASVIVFDMLFSNPHEPEDDLIFTGSLKNAGNVILCEHLEKKLVTIDIETGQPTGSISIERIIPPIESLAEAAVALAPFPLPKIPVRLSRYWAFKTGAGDIPTLPVVALNVFASDAYENLLIVIRKMASDHEFQLPEISLNLEHNYMVENIIALRNTFKANSSLAEKVTRKIRKSDVLPLGAKTLQVMEGLVGLYDGLGSPYLNFYGPPGTIETIPFHKLALLKHQPDIDYKSINLRGKAVFIGLSENLHPGQKDGFHTVFSQSNGIDISGVEIAATAFANLLEGSSIKPLLFPKYHSILFFWGLAIGVLCTILTPMLAAITITSLGVLYLSYVIYVFEHFSLWSPVVTPLLIQAPLCFFVFVLWKFWNTRKAFECYLPSEVVNQIVQNYGNIDSSAHLAYATCLLTDAQQYTKVSERLDPIDVSDLINEYFGVIFEHVCRHGGQVADIKGDSMLSYWETRKQDPESRKHACLAALEISKAANRRKKCSGTGILPTRIGLHTGKLWIGNIGAGKHFEYRPVGDIVNTVSRIESLNRYLKTRILVSRDVIENLEGFLVRKIGNFKLAGKSTPVAIYELLSRAEESNSRLEKLCSSFSAGLDAYAEMYFEDALKLFCETSRLYRKDGPSCFYMQLCEKFKENPPEEQWNGLIHMETK